jgi:hypothetical protein
VVGVFKIHVHVAAIGSKSTSHIVRCVISTLLIVLVSDEVIQGAALVVAVVLHVTKCCWVISEHVCQEVTRLGCLLSSVGVVLVKLLVAMVLSSLSSSAWLLDEADEVVIIDHD